MDNLLTNDPAALRNLMNETLFGNGFESVHYAGGEKDIISTEPVTTENSAPDFLGKNEKHYLFLIHEPAHDFFAEADLDAFAKILAAKKLSMDDVAVLNCAHHQPMDPDSLIALFKPKSLIFLGADPLWAGCKGLVLNVPAIAAGMYTLLTYSFAEMSQQQDKKKVFWSLIKQI